MQKTIVEVSPPFFQNVALTQLNYHRHFDLKWTDGELQPFTKNIIS